MSHVGWTGAIYLGFSTPSSQIEVISANGAKGKGKGTGKDKDKDKDKDKGRRVRTRPRRGVSPKGGRIQRR